MMRPVFGVVLGVALLICGPALPVHSEEEHDTAKKLKESGDILPLETIVEKALHDHPGRILEVKLETEKNRLVYELELLDRAGVVRELVYDAKTGERMQEGPDD